jgi:16S rRNA (guanine(966)-N(2))-methyltransferase RsmD
MRIIAGQFRGRRLLPPVGQTTRPITDRVKTALFNILQRRLADAFVLDLFAGTGSMGLEALSRGARFCCFAERDQEALKRLARNIQAMQLEARSRVWRGDILRQMPAWLGELDESADLVFVDPPYRMVAQWDWQRAVADLFGPLEAKLADDGLVMLRSERSIPVPRTLGRLGQVDRRDYGGMSLVFFKRGDGRQGSAGGG